jgi:hypothetical protein
MWTFHCLTEYCFTEMKKITKLFLHVQDVRCEHLKIETIFGCRLESEIF